MKKLLLLAFLGVVSTGYSQQPGLYPVATIPSTNVTVIANTNGVSGTGLSGFSTNDFSRFTLVIRNTGTIPIRCDFFDATVYTDSVLLIATGSMGQLLSVGDVFNLDRQMLNPFSIHARGDTNTTATGTLTISGTRWK